jgi:hypothetical protein
MLCTPWTGLVMYYANMCVCMCGEGVPPIRTHRSTYLVVVIVLVQAV